MKILIDSKIKNLIGTRVRIARNMNSLTQQQLSDELKGIGIFLDRPAISKIEKLSRTVTDYELKLSQWFWKSVSIGC